MLAPPPHRQRFSADNRRPSIHAHASDPHRPRLSTSSTLAIEPVALAHIAEAELTAGFILADLGIAHHPRADHASYIASWLTLLKDSPRAIFTAASQAQAAADWMHAQQLISSTAPDEVPSGDCFKIMRQMTAALPIASLRGFPGRP